MAFDGGRNKSWDVVWYGRRVRPVAEESGGDLVRLEEFEGEIEEEWQEAKGLRVFDRDGEEVGTVEDPYVWAEAVHLIKAEVEGRNVLIPTDAVTDASEDGVEVEQPKGVIRLRPLRLPGPAHFGWVTENVQAVVEMTPASGRTHTSSKHFVWPVEYGILTCATTSLPPQRSSIA